MLARVLPPVLLLEECRRRWRMEHLQILVVRHPRTRASKPVSAATQIYYAPRSQTLFGNALVSGNSVASAIEPAAANAHMCFGRALNWKSMISGRGSGYTLTIV